MTCTEVAISLPGLPRKKQRKTDTPPTCQKHGCEKVWRKSISEEKAGRWVSNQSGRWHCPECDKQIARAWAKANPEKVRAKNRAWVKANPEACAANRHRRRARKVAATSPICKVTAETITKRKALIKGCAYCGTDARLTLDHVVALADGGLHVPSNLVGACSCCNSSKQDKPVEAWFRAQPFFSEQRWQRIQTITGNGQLSLI
jgi:5-methylcytosine-specific restriction endonuclease McrA